VSPLITLTTDWGLADNYVAAAKGAILSVCPEVHIVDIDHAIAPQDIAQAVYITSTSWPYFPSGTIHIAVVDPGVGTQRRAMLVQSPDAVFIGPDNGVLSAALPVEARPVDPREVPLPAGYKAFELTEDKYFRSTVSNTFHGRDVFGPVAGHAATGVTPDQFGPPVTSLLALPLTTAVQQGDVIRGRIQHIDTFGNLVTDVPESFMAGRAVAVEVSGHLIRGLGRTYGENEGLFALVTSDGWLAVAQVNGSAAAELSASRGDNVVVR
jgi:S-adenosyl-L-methionine hydrolase (adenosine-forming)